MAGTSEGLYQFEVLEGDSHIEPARIELLDEMQVRACNAYSKLTLPEQPLLLVEFHGTEAGVREQATRFGEIAAEYGRIGCNSLNQNVSGNG